LVVGLVVAVVLVFVVVSGLVLELVAASVPKQGKML
jgi:hypothetical protein